MTDGIFPQDGGKIKISDFKATSEGKDILTQIVDADFDIFIGITNL
jgi:hypothetical protein